MSTTSAITGHAIKVEEVIETDPALDYPRYVDGASRAPPEDVGGISGFEEFLKAMQRPRHPEHKRMLERFGSPFDPTTADLDAITVGLGKLARRRTLGRAAFAKSRNAVH